MSIRYTARAREDLLGIWVDIASDNATAADRVYDRLAARVLMLQQFPEAGPIRPDIHPQARVLIEAPYLILYRLIPDGVQIVRVLHGARLLGARLFQEGVA